MVEKSINIIECIGHNFYQWKIESASDSVSVSLKSAIADLISKFENRFFALARGDTESLKKECDQFSQGLCSLISNLQPSQIPIFSGCENIFNNFHFEIMDLYRQKALEIYESFKKNYKFRNINKRLFFSNQKLEDELENFLNEIFLLKSFRSEIVAEKFISRFKDFIKDFNDSTQVAVRDFVMRIEEECVYIVNNFVFESKKKLELLLSELIDNLKVNRVLVKMQLINIEGGPESKWEIAYQGLFTEDEIVLKQVLAFNENSFFISLGCECLNVIHLVIMRDFTSVIVKNSISDSETLIASGSIPDSLILFKNTEKKCLQGCVQEDRKFITLSEIPLYSTTVQEILSAGYLRASKEVLYSIADGTLGYFQLNKKEKKNVTYLPPTNSQIRTSLCGKYMTLISASDIALLDSQMRIVYMYGAVPDHTIVEESQLKMLFLNSENGIYVKSIKVNLEEVKTSSTTEKIFDKVKLEFRKTVELGEGLFTGILGNNTYVANQAELAPVAVRIPSNLNITKVVKIQAMWRGRKVRKELKKKCDEALKTEDV